MIAGRLQRREKLAAAAAEIDDVGRRRRRSAGTRASLSRDARRRSRETDPRSRRTCSRRRLSAAGVPAVAARLAATAAAPVDGAGAASRRRFSMPVARCSTASCARSSGTIASVGCCCSIATWCVVERGEPTSRCQLAILGFDERGDLLQERDQRRLELLEGGGSLARRDRSARRSPSAARALNACCRSIHGVSHAARRERLRPRQPAASMARRRVDDEPRRRRRRHAHQRRIERGQRLVVAPIGVAALRARAYRVRRGSC